MGQITNARILAWQQRAGIVPAHGRRLQTLDQMSQSAFALIKVLALERAGIRDGDGQWHGSDPVANLIHDLVRTNALDLKACHAEQGAGQTPEDDADVFEAVCGVTGDFGEPGTVAVSICGVEGHFECTRKPLHVGDHIAAHADGYVLERWPQNHQGLP